MGGNGRQAFGEIMFTIRGITQHTQHNGQAANPMNTYARKMKAITSKKKKTDEDLEELLKLKWMSGLYVNKAGRVVIPGRVIEGAYVEAARRTKEGRNVQAALWSPAGQDDWPLDFPGKERSIDALMQDEDHFLVSRVGVNGKTIVTARPTFPQWSLTYRVRYFPTIFNEREVIEFTETLGSLIGLSDDRAIRGGRFEIESATAHSIT
jgi:hypothetical protein